MKDYVSPELRYILVNAQDVITASVGFQTGTGTDIEYDVKDWLGGNE